MGAFKRGYMEHYIPRIILTGDACHATTRLGIRNDACLPFFPTDRSPYLNPSNLLAPNASSEPDDPGRQSFAPIHFPALLPRLPPPSPAFARPLPNADPINDTTRAATRRWARRLQTLPGRLAYWRAGPGFRRYISRHVSRLGDARPADRSTCRSPLIGASAMSGRRRSTPGPWEQVPLTRCAGSGRDGM